MNPHCSACLFFDDQDPGGGHCRQAPPRVFVVPGDDDPVKTLWPRVTHDDWCGQFSVPDFREVDEAPKEPRSEPPTEYPVKPTKADPCPECQSMDGKHFHTMRDFDRCPKCGALDEIPF